MHIILLLSYCPWWSFQWATFSSSPAIPSQVFQHTENVIIIRSLFYYIWTSAAWCVRTGLWGSLYISCKDVAGPILSTEYLTIMAIFSHLVMKNEIWMNCKGVMRKWELGGKYVAETWRGKETNYAGNVTKNRETKKRTGEHSISISLTDWISWLMWLWGGHVSFRVQYEHIVTFSARWCQN